MGFIENKLIRNYVNSFPGGPCLRSFEHCVDLTPLFVSIGFYLVILLADNSSLL